jgi:exonuclease SbcC
MREGVAMQPCSLQLDGFTGIRSATGKESFFIDFQSVPKEAKLIAFIGPNGAGKTTIMDNMHPYRVMPSRSSTLGPGGFSYWDQICLPQAKKILIWIHNGEKYRTSLIFKMTGKTKKADCYLEIWSSISNNWEPLKLDDGTFSDGKTDTYDRCLESVLGSPETFFTSVFSSQKKKSISSYGANDFKAILANILSLDYLRDLSSKAAMVGKLLRFQLDGLQDVMSQARNADAGVHSTTIDVQTQQQVILDSEEFETVVVAKHDQVKLELTQIEARQESQAKDIEQRSFLQSQLEKIKLATNSRTVQIIEQFMKEKGDLMVNKASTILNLNDLKFSIGKSETEIARLNTIIAKKDSILLAEGQISILKTQIAEIDVKLIEAHEKTVALPNLRSQLQTLKIEEAGLVTSGNAKRMIVIAQKKTAELTTQVPCAEEQFQSRCPLMKEAVDAKIGLPSKQEEIQALRVQCESIRVNIAEVSLKIDSLVAVEQTITSFNSERNKLTEKVENLSQLAALNDVLSDAIKRSPELIAGVVDMNFRKSELESKLIALELGISQIDQNQKLSIDSIVTSSQTEMDDVDAQLLKLSQPITEDEILRVKSHIASIQNEVNVSRAKTQQGRNQLVALLAKVEAYKEILKQTQLTIAEANRLTDEIAKWKLIEKGTGNDGLVALSIDDAGPEIAAICNDLLKTCFGGRFSVRLETQSETQSGNIKETFKVVVFDNHRAEEKELDDVSGGEGVWINEALTRAIALYKGECSGVQYHTLFTDEADGPLDPERKREFMAMKRYVLERGGYMREFFISQTPELWEMADHIIDVTTL